MNKHFFALFLSALIVFSFSACGSDKTPATEAVQAPTIEETAPATKIAETATPVEEVSSAALESAGTLGAYDIQINDFELCKDYMGTPAILVSYSFTNNSDENASAIVSLHSTAYQNGVQLDSGIIMDGNLYNANDLMKELQPGASIDVKAAFTLISETAPVEFEITESFSFADDKLGKTFEISEGGITEINVAPTGETINTIGDYTISVISHEPTADYEGKSAILITLGFTNNSDDTTNFVSSINLQAFQDGIELETAILMDANTGTSQMCNLRPGAGRAVTAAFILTSDTSPVELEIEEMFSFSDEKLTTTLNIA